MFEPASVPAGLVDELLAISLAAVIFTTGGVAIAGALSPRSSERRILAFLGAFAVLYGIRLSVSTRLAYLLIEPDHVVDFVVAYVTYLIPIPAFLLFHGLVGAVREVLFRIAMAVQVTYSICAIAIDTALNQPYAAMDLNAPIIIAVSFVMLPRILRSNNVEPSELRPLRIGIAVFILFALHENLASMGVIHSRTGLEPIGMLVFLCGVGISISRRVARTNIRLREIESELAVAQRIQASLLPRSAPPIGGLDIAATQIPANEVGGDFYDFVPLGDHAVGFLVADVAGHGVPAALIASMVKIALVSLRDAAQTPAQLLTAMNAILCGQIARGFVTAAYCVVDLERRSIVVARAGHPAPLLIAPDGTPELLESDGPVLGRFRDAVFTQIERSVPAGARLVLYTDGVTEARAPDGSTFGEARLGLVRAGADGDAAGHLASILAALDQFQGSARRVFEDDVTLVVVKFRG